MSDNTNDDVASQVQSKINELEQSLKNIEKLNENAYEMLKTNDVNFLLDPKYDILDQINSVFRLERTFYSKHERSIAARNSFNQNAIDKYLRTVLEGLVTLSSITKRLKIVYDQIIAAESFTEEFRKRLEKFLGDVQKGFKFLIRECKQFAVPVPSNVPEQPNILESLGSITFKPQEVSDPRVTNELKKYADLGRAIKNSDEANEITREIDRMISYLNSVSGQSILDESSESFSRTFLAIVAPSMVGKTQLSFNLSENRSLYFALNQYLQFDSPGVQEIYLNYSSSNQNIYKFAKIDTDRIISALKITDPSASKQALDSAYKFISAEYITTKFEREKFYTLGFFVALIEDAQKRFDETGSMSWMEFHAKRPEMEIRPVSIQELQNKPDYFKKYFVFLDEFTESFTYVFIRNVCRAANFVCAVASTNSVIASLVDRNQSTSSGPKPNNVWSLVITELDQSNLGIWERTASISALVNSIQVKLNAHDPLVAERFRIFVDDVIQRQISFIRPGIMEFFVSALEKMSKQSELKMKEVGFLDFIFNEIQKGIIESKCFMNTDIEAFVGTFALHSSLAYNNKYPDLNSRTKSSFNDKLFLSKHLYYAINPVDSNSWFFKLYESTSLTPPFCIKMANGTVTEWVEFTYFKEEDHLTALACIFGTIPNTVASLMRSSYIKNLSNPKDYNMPSPKKKTNPDLYLETCCSISSIDASHFVANRTGFIASFAGVYFPDYLKNIILNLVEKAPFRQSNSAKLPISLQIPTELKCFENAEQTFNLLNYLNKFKVPFLGPSNVEWPDVYKRIFPLNDASCSVKLGTFSRAKKSDELDGYFDIIQDPGDAAGYKVCEAVMECKDFCINLPSDDTLSILQKAFKRSRNEKPVKFSFIYCNSLGGIVFDQITDTDVNIKKLREYLIAERENLFRFSLNSLNVFECIPYRKDVPIFDNPRLACFIYIMEDIDRYVLPFQLNI